MAKKLRYTLPVLAVFLFAGLSITANAGKPTDPPEPESTGPDRMIVLGDDSTNGFQAFPFTSINSIWCRPHLHTVEVSHIRISDNQLFSTVVHENPTDYDSACKAWFDYLNGDGPQPPINP